VKKGRRAIAKNRKKVSHYYSNHYFFAIGRNIIALSLFSDDKRIYITNHQVRIISEAADATLIFYIVMMLTRLAQLKIFM
jgi:hypothetical protein